MTLAANRTNSQTTGQQRGFTLLEILVALSIVAIALTAVFRALGAGTRSAESLGDRLLADWIADNRLVELRVGASTPVPGTAGEVILQAGRSFYRREEIRTTADTRVLRAEIVVTRETADGEPLSRLAADLLVKSRP